MFRHSKLSLFGAGLVAVLAACHPNTPVQSASSANAVQCADASAAPSSREARGSVGFAPANATAAPCLSATSAKPSADALSGDDPIWRLDMP
jgi:hypothetical protein